MAPKPEPRPYRAAKSQYANARPLVANPSEAEGPAADEQAAMAPRPERPAPEGRTPQAPAKPKKKKANFYQTEEEAARAEAARIHTMGHTGLLTWTAYVEEAVRQFTHSLEREYNDSRPFG